MKKITSVFLLFITCFQFSIGHPFYVSVTQIDFKNKTLQITLKVFVEDLEETLQSEGQPKLNLGEKNEINNSQKYLLTYLKNHFEIYVNNEKRKYEYVGKEVEDDAVWIYLEIKEVKEISELGVMNSIIIDKYEGQTNLIHTNIDGQKKSLILNKARVSDKLTF